MKKRNYQQSKGNTSNFLIFLFVVIIFMMMMFRGKNVLKRLLSGAMKQLLREIFSLHLLSILIVHVLPECVKGLRVHTLSTILFALLNRYDYNLHFLITIIV